LIVEIDGGQHDPSSELEANRTRFLESEGYRVLRFWNNEVLDNPDGTQAMIAEDLWRVGVLVSFSLLERFNAHPFQRHRLSHLH